MAKALQLRPQNAGIGNHQIDRLGADGLLEGLVILSLGDIQLVNDKGRIDLCQLVKRAGTIRIPTAGDDLVIPPQAGMGEGETKSTIGSGNQHGSGHDSLLVDRLLLLG